MGDNIYQDAEKIRARVANGDHRAVIGGRWDEIGAWQFEFAKSRGLLPQHRLLDVGCGSLRGGVKFVEYLDPDHYAGIDAHEELLNRGYEAELAPLGLTNKLSRSRLIASDTFDLTTLEEPVDMAIAVSVFTHISLNQIRMCLASVSRKLAPGACFYATYFELPPGQKFNQVIDRGEGIFTHYDRNPFHYSIEDMQRIVEGLPLEVERIGDVGHPRGQFMLAFRKTGAAEVNDVRGLDAAEALNLKAGADHYRAYVGPPRRFDFMSATQFALLYAMGLRDEDYVLDVGCGSLRLGRLLIPFLLEDRYFGIDPNQWLIDEAIERELGQSAVNMKRPRFSNRDDFDVSAFGQAFDYIVAQSVATHTGPDMLTQLIKGCSEALDEDGLFLFSYICGDEPAENGWHYPACVEYTEADMIRRLSEYGLVAKPIPWFHPAASWMCAARSEAMLPSDEKLRDISGKVIERPTTDKGYVTRKK